MKVLLTILIAFFSGFIFSQVKEIPAMGNVFWEISNKDNKNVSYLFGTIHLIDKDKYVLPKTVTKRLEKSDLVIMEIANLDDQSGMMEMITLKKGRMTDVLSKIQRDSLYDFTERKFGMDSSMFESSMGKFKPVFFMQLPYASLLMRCESYDKNLNALAQMKDIPIEGLETAEEQLGYFDNLSSEMQAKMIMQVIHDTSDLKKTWNDMQELYLNQQVSDMLTFNSGGADVMQFYEKTLSSDRNLRWIKTLSTRLNEKSTFIAVGAGHLPGDEGLINLLRKEAFIVSPVQIKLN
tara:strand:+ start:54426 stop:55304 length:879 start_codon:yes stop_codon:yes gene_type:complete